ncbi:membrane-bound ghrelin O-acyltransferase mboat4 [Genypterus blacodes]|uniref:membrane-bound ghrelin O-acyltransferase mboat4 n=1 Tax=Genypterus blacodes TaxID=154954 RepID=UPI003F75F12E
MDVVDSLYDQHQFLMQQFLSLPFALLFYFLAKHGYLTLIYRYLFVCVGGCVLAVVTMGIYSLLLFASTFVFILLVYSNGPTSIHAWVFGIQMWWQTFWHLIIQYSEYYLHEPVSIRLFQAVSCLMLITQRMTSFSMDLQEKLLVVPGNAWPQGKSWLSLLPLVSYILNFTTLLGGPLCSYSQFVSFIAGVSPAPNPLVIDSLKVMLVLLLEWFKYCLVYVMKNSPYDPSNSGIIWSITWVCSLGVVLRIQYYSHWRISECLNNAAGLGVRANLSVERPNWSSNSDGDFWTIETSSRISKVARQWNATTSSWLRRLVYARCRAAPLFMTFAFSAWWHGLHPGHLVGFLAWAAAVKADHHIHRYTHPRLSSTWTKGLYTCFSWINTQMILTCVVVAVEFRDMSGLRLLSVTYLGLFPLLNIILLFIFTLKNYVLRSPFEHL